MRQLKELKQALVNLMDAVEGSGWVTGSHLGTTPITIKCRRELMRRAVSAVAEADVAEEQYRKRLQEFLNNPDGPQAA
jgi:hypothetical protein